MNFIFKGTAQDLIERGVNTFIVMDAVSASSDVNRFSAFREMEHIGCRLVTSEQVEKLDCTFKTP